MTFPFDISQTNKATDRLKRSALKFSFQTSSFQQNKAKWQCGGGSDNGGVCRHGNVVVEVVVVMVAVELVVVMVGW